MRRAFGAVTGRSHAVSRPKRVSVEVSMVEFGRYGIATPRSRNRVLAVVALNTPNCGGRGRPVASVYLEYVACGRRRAVPFAAAAMLDPRLLENPAFSEAWRLADMYGDGGEVRNARALGRIRKFMSKGTCIIGPADRMKGEVK